MLILMCQHIIIFKFSIIENLIRIYGFYAF